jgi:demethylmenaquinone methyltransferase/2-methoxy-6-polyprenyl-1,4-benzoquinol methylase
MRGTDYDRLARFYDPLLGPALARLRRMVRDVLLAEGAASAVDLCCGTGHQLRVLQAAGLRVAGVDRSAGMLARARAAGPESIDYHHGDATAAPFPDHAFDAACACLSLHEMAEETRLAVLAEAARLARPGGMVLVADYRPGKTPWPRPGRLGIALAERLAGGEHHRQYRDFLSRGGARGVMVRAGLDPRRKDMLFSGGVGVYVALTPS